MEFADYPKHIRHQWKEIEETWNRAVDRRGRRRHEALNDVRDWMCGKIHGLEIHLDQEKDKYEMNLKNLTWKSEEYERNERLVDSLDKANAKILEFKRKYARSIGYTGNVSLYKDIPEPFDLADKPVGAKFEQSPE